MPTVREDIEKWSKAYATLKYYVDFCFRFYFKTTVAGLENIPRKGTTIFTPNHQNALMDALGLLTTKHWQPIFLARADIFEKPTINKILTFLKIMPVYRIRDGYQNLSKNDAIFRKTMDVIRNENGLVILPEGNHGDRKRLRSLKKGFARIAFQAVDDSNGELEIKIVPVGMDYTHYVNVGSELHIRFGNPINVKPLLNEYRENQAKAFNQLIELLENGLKKEMIHIDDEKYYNSYMTILDAFSVPFLVKQKVHITHENKIDLQNLIISKIDKLKNDDFDSYLVLMAKTIELEKQLQKLNLNPQCFPSDKQMKFNAFKRLGLLILSLPLFIYSFINNIIPLSIPYFATKKLKDVQFHSTFQFALGLLIFPIFHFIQVLIFGLVSTDWILTLAYATSLPATVYFYFNWREWFFSILSPFREIILEKTKPKEIKHAKEVYETLSKKVWDLSQSKSVEDSLPSYLTD